MATRAERTVVFPVGMRLMRFFGPHPSPGTPVECLIRITSLTDTALEADAQLLIGGEVWAELSGWQDRRFDNHPDTRPVERFPQRNTLSRPQPGGWVLLHERWPDLASRDLIMRNHLGRAERTEYEHQPPRGRRQWLLGRIAAKDAVRRWLWDHGEGPVFPAEIGIRDDAQGRPYAIGVHGRTLPELALSLAHRAEAGVALVVPRAHGAPGPGIALEEVAHRDDHALAAAFGRAERELLATATAGGGDSRARWATTFRPRRRRSPRRRALPCTTGRMPSSSPRHCREPITPTRHRPGSSSRWRPPPPGSARAATRSTAAPSPTRPDCRTGTTPWPGRPARTTRNRTRRATSDHRQSDRLGTPADAPAVLAEISGMLRTMLDEYGLDDIEVTMETRFTEDLELESIDLVALAYSLEARYGRQVNFAEFVAGLELDEIIDLTVGQLVEYVVRCLRAAGES